MMSTTSTEDCIRFLDEIIESRRSIRSFKNDIPSKDAIKAIIRAGLFAPYAGAALDQKDFRHFVVIQNGSPTMAKAGELMQRQIKAMSEKLNLEMQRDPALQSRAQKFAKRLEAISKDRCTRCWDCTLLHSSSGEKGLSSSRTAVFGTLPSEYVAEGYRA